MSSTHFRDANDLFAGGHDTKRSQFRAPSPYQYRERGDSRDRDRSRSPRNWNDPRDEFPSYDPEGIQQPTSGITYTDHNGPCRTEFHCDQSHFAIPRSFKEDFESWFTRGDVIGERHCEFAFNERGSIGSPEFEPSSAGKMCVKHRVPYVVKQVFQTHLECWSGRCCGDNGLLHIPHLEKAMYVGLGDIDDSTEGCDSPHSQAKVTREPGSRRIEPKTHVKTNRTHEVIPTVGWVLLGKLGKRDLERIDEVGLFCGNLENLRVADISKIKPELGIDICALQDLQDWRLSKVASSLQQAHRPAARLPAPITAAPPRPTRAQPSPRPVISTPSNQQPNGVSGRQTAPERIEAPRASTETTARGDKIQIQPTTHNRARAINHVNFQENAGGFYLQGSPQSPQRRDRSRSRDDRQRRYENGGEFSRRQTVEEEDELPYDD